MKRIVFLTGTRADFGKIKPLIQILQNSSEFEPFIFVTGMHLQKEYGYTILEIEKCNFKNIASFENYTQEATMDLTLAKTIEGFSTYIKSINPHLIVVHGDRVEAMAGAITGSLNNTLVAHIEGGELSGTIDELIRHSVSKLCHIHFVANENARNRLIQMGELPTTIFKIGSPEVDSMFSSNLPTLPEVKSYYEIPFKKYAIVMFHPITTEIDCITKYIENLKEALLLSRKNYVVIYPNNDLGSSKIIEVINTLKGNPNFRVLPSLRFEYFLTLLKNAEFIIGNSSSGVREAPYFNIKTVNIGTRQQNRTHSSSIINCDYTQQAINEAINCLENIKIQEHNYEFGNGNSAEKFLNYLMSGKLWKVNHQKQFRDI